MDDRTSTQESLFQDPLGVQLRLAREQAGLTIENVGAQLRLPTAIVDAMEREDWTRLGATIYVRSYVGSYLRLLGLPEALLAQATANDRAAPPLVTLATRSRMRHTLDTTLRNAVYLVMTAVLVVPVVLVARHYQARDRVQDLTLEADGAVRVAPAGDAGAAPAGPSDAATTVATADTPDRVPVDAPAPVAAAAAPDPVMASMTPFASAAAADSLVLTFEDESWIDVVGPDGARIERGLVPAGELRRFEAGRVGHVTLGNADGVRVEHAGREIDLTPFRAANVARFAVSSDGAPAPATN